MKRKILLVVAFLLIVSGSIIGQENPSSSAAITQEKTPSKNAISPAQPVEKRVNIFYQRGSVILPEGYKGYRTEGFIDAWFGYIESPDGNFRINFMDGLVESLFEKYEKKIVWTKVDNTQELPIKISLMREKDQERLIANIRDTQFIGLVKSEDDKNVFMQIVRSFRPGKCDACRTLAYKAQSK